MYSIKQKRLYEEEPETCIKQKRLNAEEPETSVEQQQRLYPYTVLPRNPQIGGFQNFGGRNNLLKQYLSNGTCVYASVVREIFDKKAESKTLSFLLAIQAHPDTKLQALKANALVFIKRKGIPPNTLFHEDNS
jgi:hypothetical protein